MAKQVGTFTLDDGFEITYHVVGDQTKPWMVFLIGSSGLGSLYQRTASELSPYFRCVYFDKRGFLSKNSTATKSQNVLVSVEHQADDAAALIKHLSSNSPVYVFGTSTGGTVTLDLVCRYPALIHTAIIHEPIVFSVLPSHLNREMINVYQDVATMQDSFHGFAVFANYMFNTPDKPRLDSKPRHASPSTSSRTSKPSLVEIHNSRQGQKMETQIMIDYLVDKTKTREVAHKLVLVCGIDSKSMRVCMPAIALSEQFQPQKRLWEMAGGHISFADRRHARSFCQQLVFVLQQEGKYKWSLPPETLPTSIAKI